MGKKLDLIRKQDTQIFILAASYHLPLARHDNDLLGSKVSEKALFLLPTQPAGQVTHQQTSHTISIWTA